MKKYKNTELAKQYKVSEKTIRNWIAASHDKNINLQIIKDGTREYIVDTPNNHLLMEELSKKGKKYRNKKSLQVIEPKKELFEIYQENQIIDLISNLDVFHEIDLKYVYFRGGAEYWDDYFHRSLKEKGNNTPKNTILLMEQSYEYIFSLVKEYDHINIIDIGVGNAEPVKGLLDFLSEKKKLSKYIAIDYSQDIINIAKKNMQNWFGDNNFELEFHTRDITYDGIRDLLFINTQNHNSINLVLFIGSTIENQRLNHSALNMIKNSIGVGDYFFLGQTLDSPSLKMMLNYNYQTQDPSHHREAFFYVPDMLNLNDSHYEVERFYDAKESARVVQLKLRVDIDLKFKFGKLDKVIHLNNKDTITVYRHKHHNFNDVINGLNEKGFQSVYAITSPDYGNIMVVSKLKRAR